MKKPCLICYSSSIIVKHFPAAYIDSVCINSYKHDMSIILQARGQHWHLTWWQMGGWLVGSWELNCTWLFLWSCVVHYVIIKSSLFLFLFLLWILMSVCTLQPFFQSITIFCSQLQSLWFLKECRTDALGLLWSLVVNVAVLRVVFF